MFFKIKYIQPILAAILLVTVIFSSFQPLTASVQAQEGDGIVRDYNTETGKVTMISGENNEPIVVLSAMQARMSSQRQADVLLQTFAPEFGITDPASDLQIAEQSQPSENRVTTRYQQVYNDVPVIAAELIVNANDQGALSSISGEVAQDLSLDTNPSITADSAVEIAKQGMVKWYGGVLTDYVHTEAVLSIFDEKLLRPSIRPAELVWQIEMVPTDQMQPIREFVVVNAKTGNIPLHFNQIDTEWSNANVNAGINQPPQQNYITSTPIATEIPVTETPIPIETAIPTEASLLSDVSPSTDTSASDIDALAVTLYVKASGGSDANTCLSVALACATINGAIGKAAASGDTIKVTTGTFTGTGTEVILINKSITISGGWNTAFTSQSGMSTIDGQNARKGIVNGDVTASLDRFNVKKGQTSNAGAGINNIGNLTITNSSIESNSAADGGGIYSWNSQSSVTLNNSTINNNSATSTGGGVYSQGSLTLNNSTLSNNSANSGGGIYNEAGSLILNNSTISNNIASSYGGGIYTFGGNALLLNSILGENTTPHFGPDCYGSLTSNGNNIISNTSDCAVIAVSGDKFNINPVLGTFLPVQGYHPLLPGSPAINAGNSVTCLPADQRGVARVGTCDIGAYEYATPGTATTLSLVSGSGQRTPPNFAFSKPLIVVVVDGLGSPVPNVNVTFTAPGSGARGTFANTGANTTSVLTDAGGIATTSTFIANNQFGIYNVSASASGLSPVNFSLENAGWYVSSSGIDSNSCSATASPCLTINGAIGKAMAGDVIVVAAGAYTGTGNSVITISKSLRLSGGWNGSFTTQTGASTIDGQNSRRGVSVLGGITINATLERFAITNGNMTSGGIEGGGIYNGGVLALNNVTLSNNIATYGGGINNYSGILTLNNVTLSNNMAAYGGGVYNYNGLVMLKNTLIAANNQGSDCYGTIVSSGYNLIGNNSNCIFNATTGDLVGTSVNPINSRLTPLQDNGGTTLTHALKGGSPAINAGNPSTCLSTDQRGVARPQGITCDIGAFEYQPGTTPSSISVLQGSPQIIGLGTVASQNFSVVVSDALGAGIQAITVTFTISLSGPSGVFSNTGTNVTTAITGFNGVATASTFTANTTPGSYTVQATVNGLAGSAVFNLTNSNGQISTYTANNTSLLPGTLLCTQSQPNCTNGGNPDADAAHKYAFGTYHLYATQFNRDSVDNNGMTITSTVHFCDPNCPFDNAYWSGTQMVYGAGYPLADDVVGHELTHGVTQYESNLYYFYQSGAINESLSDVFGEYYDQTNGLGTDTPAVKWLHGEDLPGGAYRNMSNPPQFNDPDKMSSIFYVKTDEDSGGVHHNSGLNNKAAFLMVDGGTFNGFTVAGIGWDKTAAIYYEVNTNLLSSGADYSDLYYAAQQACTNLSLSNYKGITSADCNQVKKALDAVEMNSQPAPDFSADATICPGGGSTGVALSLFSDNFENGTGKWVLGNNWSLGDFYAASPIHMMYGSDSVGSSTSILQMNTPVTLPVGTSYLYFKHAYAFENDGTTYYDGGVLEYSINNGSTWVDAKDLFSSGQNYGGTVYADAGSSNTLQGRLGFVGDSHGYTSSRYTLTPLAGKNVKFRWVFATDQFYGYLGWVLDDVKVYTCVDNIPSIPVQIAPANNVLITDYTPVMDWSDVTANFDHYQVQVAANNTFTTPVYDVNNLLISQYAVPTNLNPNTTYFWRVRAFNTLGETNGWTAVRTFRTALLPPTLALPANGAALLNNRPTFDWGDVAGAANYTLQASTVSTFASLSVNATAISSTYTPTVDLPANHTIYWRVHANGTNGPSLWSSVFTLTTDNAPTVPALVAPTENLLISTTSTPKLDWVNSTLPAGVTFGHYQLQVAADAAFSSIVLTRDVTGIASSEFTLLTPLPKNAKYYWRVRSFNSVNHSSSWSLVRSFRIALPAPALTLPISGAALPTHRPAFDWSDVSGASNYTIQVATAPAFSPLVLNATASSSTYSATINLPANKILYWRVRSNGTNGPSAWSSVSTLSIAKAPSIPTLVAPRGNFLTTSYTPKLDWHNSSVAVGVTFDHYHVQVSTNASFSSIVAETNISGIASSEYVTPALVPNTKYYWRVRSFNSIGQYSNWSQTRSFRTALPSPALTAPSGPTGSLNLKPTFDWLDVSGASSYTLQVSKVSNFSTLLLGATASASAHTPVANLPAHTTLYWRVRTNGTNGPSKWSPTITFIIQ